MTNLCRTHKQYLRLELAFSDVIHLFELFDLFERHGATLRLVGGSVRDGLLGLPVSDIDLAVDRDPHWVMDLLRTHHIKVIPTGIDHGTVTAVIDKRPYQITTLRVDVQTFGRRAQVAFTENWVHDAMRRDFTMNAIYADKNGHLFDPVGGLEDLHAKRVRFIGDAALRIQEDYLRILRFFRFSARFGHEPYDAAGLQACAAYASRVSSLARERVTEEFLKILELPTPLYALEAMQDTGVLTVILHPDPSTGGDLKALVALEVAAGTGTHPSALLRLAALSAPLDETKAHLRLSKKQAGLLTFLNKNHYPVTPTSFKHQAYVWGKERVLDLCLLQAARRLSAGHASLEKEARVLGDLHHQFDDWEIPSFPLTGADLLREGVQQGKDVGALLKAVEAWWVAEDLTPDRQACLAHLQALLENGHPADPSLGAKVLRPTERQP